MRPLLPRPLLLSWRHPALHLGVVALAALLAGAVAFRITDRAARASARLGEGVEVPVALEDVPPGAVLDPSTVALRRRPASLVPPGAVEGLPVGRVVRQALAEGEVVVGSRLAGPGVEGPAALVPEGWRGVAVPADAGARPPLVPGDIVDVLATFDPLVAGEAGQDPTLVVAEAAVVVDVADHAVTVAVPARGVPHLAYAAATGTVTLALAG